MTAVGLEGFQKGHKFVTTFKVQLSLSFQCFAPTFVDFFNITFPAPFKRSYAKSYETAWTGVAIFSKPSLYNDRRLLFSLAPL